MHCQSSEVTSGLIVNVIVMGKIKSVLKDCFNTLLSIAIILTTFFIMYVIYPVQTLWIFSFVLHFKFHMSFCVLSYIIACLLLCISSWLKFCKLFIPPLLYFISQISTNVIWDYAKHARLINALCCIVSI